MIQRRLRYLRPYTFAGNLRAALLACAVCMGMPQFATAQDSSPTSAGNTSAGSSIARSQQALTIGAPAPDFELVGLGEKKTRLSDYQGQKSVVLVFVRAHW